MWLQCLFPWIGIKTGVFMSILAGQLLLKKSKQPPSLFLRRCFWKNVCCPNGLGNHQQIGRLKAKHESKLLFLNIYIIFKGQRSSNIKKQSVKTFSVIILKMFFFITVMFVWDGNVNWKTVRENSLLIAVFFFEKRKFIHPPHHHSIVQLHYIITQDISAFKARS